MRYRFARALATRINASAFDQSPLFPASCRGISNLILMTNPRILVLIPARMAAARLPGKPLLEMAGLPMIVHVLRRAEAAGIGRGGGQSARRFPDDKPRQYSRRADAAGRS